MKKKKKNMMAQVMAWLALFAIVIGIVGTGLLVLFTPGEQSGYSDENVPTLSQEELQRIIQESSVTVEGQEVNITAEDFTSEEINITASGSAQ